MSTSRRRTVRDELVARLTATNKYQAVYGHLTTDVQGQTPVACVDTLGTNPGFETPHKYDEIHEFAIWHLVRRSPANTAEEKLDELEASLQTLCEQYVTHGNYWKLLKRLETSSTDIVDIDGTPWRVEAFRISVQVTP